MVRPAAALRHQGMDRAVPLIGSAIVALFPPLSKQLKVDTSRPGFLKLRSQDIEWVTGNVTFDTVKKANEGPTPPLHARLSGRPNDRAIRLAGVPPPVEVECEEVRFGGRAYYKVTGDLAKTLGPKGCFFLPDDRTIVFDEEPVIRKFVSGKQPELPAFLRGQAWERASRGLLASPSRTRTTRSPRTTT